MNVYDQRRLLSTVQQHPAGPWFDCNCSLLGHERYILVDSVAAIARSETMRLVLQWTPCGSIWEDSRISHLG